MSSAAGLCTAWFHCFSGIAGDMALGALLDAGADLEEVRALLERLPLRGWSLDAEPVLRAGLAATRAVVGAEDDGVVRTHRHIVGLVEEARLPERVHSRVLATFAALAEAEGRLHGRPAAQVHFHEVGGHDAIVDVVGTCAALEVLGVEAVASSPVATGIGTVRTAHGVFPNPVPAVVELLRGAPMWGRDLNLELTTPTGAALLVGTGALFGPLPEMLVERSGYGAGSREIDGMPNVTQVVIGAATAPASPLPGAASQPLVLLEANVDDATGEVMAHALARLMEEGANDAWLAPVVMKKGRPGQVVAALADPALAGRLAEVLRSETGSLGVRGQLVQRWAAARSIERVEVGGGTVRVKVGGGRVKAEQEDAAEVGRRERRPLREVMREAEEKWRKGPGGEGEG